MKNIKVDDKIWEKLSRLKLDWKKKRIADVIEELVKCKFKKQSKQR